MNIDFKELKKDLSTYKVYDAWQYVESLLETLTYMDVSYSLLEKVDQYKKDAFSQINQETFEAAKANPGKGIPITQTQLNKANINIAGLEIGSSLFLRKTTLEFFHYARLSIDILSQIINAALFGDDAFPISTPNLPSRITQRLNDNNAFPTLYSIISSILTNPELQYAMAFDNYVKHIRTVLVSIKNNLLFSQGADQFDILPFVFKGVTYSATSAVHKAATIQQEVYTLIDQALTEVKNQLPNCQGTQNRYQLLKFKQLYKETNKGLQHQYISFFLEVDNGICDLSNEISIMPLIVKPNGEVFSFVLDFDTVFITHKGQGEKGICGIAEALPVQNSNELYQKFSVKAASIADYGNYIATFQQKYTHLSFNANALEGEIIIYKDENPEDTSVL